MTDLQPVDPIGACLRSARLDRELTIENVTEALRIPARSLEALEEERWNDLPGRVYAEGFLRRYADFLGLDGPALAARLREGLGRPEKLDIHDPRPVPETVDDRSTAPARMGFVFVGLVVLGAAAVYYFRKPDLGFFRLDLPLNQVAESELEAPAIGAAPAPAPEPPAPATKHTAVLQARDKVWVSIRLDDQLRYEGLLDQGETREWGFDRGVRLRTGNLSRVNLIVDGQAFPASSSTSPGNLSWPVSRRPVPTQGARPLPAVPSPSVPPAPFPTGPSVKPAPPATPAGPSSAGAPTPPAPAPTPPAKP